MCSFWWNFLLPCDSVEAILAMLLYLEKNTNPISEVFLSNVPLLGRCWRVLHYTSVWVSTIWGRLSWGPGFTLFLFEGVVLSQALHLTCVMNIMCLIICLSHLTMWTWKQGVCSCPARLAEWTRLVMFYSQKISVCVCNILEE